MVVLGYGVLMFLFALTTRLRIVAVAWALFLTAIPSLASEYALDCGQLFSVPSRAISETEFELRSALGWYLETRGGGILPISRRETLEDIYLDQTPILQNSKAAPFFEAIFPEILRKAYVATDSPLFGQDSVLSLTEMDLLGKTLSRADFNAIARKGIPAIEIALRGAIKGRWHFAFQLDRFDLSQSVREVNGRDFFLPDNQHILEQLEVLRTKLVPVAPVIRFRTLSKSR